MLASSACTCMSLPKDPVTSLEEEGGHRWAGITALAQTVHVKHWLLLFREVYGAEALRCTMAGECLK